MFFGLRRDGLEPNVQLEVVIATRCFANMSKVACAPMARN